MKEFIEIRNSFTRECDEYLKDKFRRRGSSTYLIEWDPKYTNDKINRHFAIRVSGATRGDLKIDRDTNEIKSISFDEYTSFIDKIGCYNKCIMFIIKKYIGRSIKNEIGK